MTYHDLQISAIPGQCKSNIVSVANLQSRSSNSQPSSLLMLQTSDNSHLECIRRQITAICNCKWSAKKIRLLQREGGGHIQPK